MTPETFIADSKGYFDECFTERIVRTKSGVDIACYLRKQGHKHTLVLIPGTFSPHFKWANMIRSLDIPVDIMVADWPGIGKSAPKMPDTTLEELTGIMLDAVDKAGVGSFIFGGHSLGGMAAVEALRQADDRMIGSIPCEGWTHYTVQQNAYGNAPKSMLNQEEETRSLALRSWCLQGWTEEERKAFAKVWRKWNGYDALVKTPLPVLEIWGDRGMNPRPTQETMQIPNRSNIEIAWIKNACHSYLINKPGEVAAAINAFVKRII